MFLVKRRYVPALISALTLPVRLILALLLRGTLLALKPLVHVRIGQYYSVSLGMWAIPMELYLCQKDAGWYPKRSLDLFYHFNKERHLLKNPPKPRDQICNQQLDVMLGRNVRVTQFAATLEHLNGLIPRGADAFRIPGTNLYDQHDMFKTYPAHLEFTEAEEQYGRSALKELGVEPDSKFVCFYARDGAYINQNVPRMTTLFGRWDTTNWRNSSIENYLPAADQCTDQGYYAFRMGKWAEKPLEHPNPKVIDYATHHHSDFLDVYLSARCQYFIGDVSGMTHLPSIFRTPMVLVNIMAFAEVIAAGGPNTVFVPKLYYSAKMGRLMSLTEVMSEPLLSRYPGKFDPDAQEYYDRIGLEILENTPEEISGAAAEMDQRLAGTFRPSEEELESQRRFSEIVRNHPEGLADGRQVFANHERLTISSHFLNMHPELLD